jgi:ribosomal protein S13
MLLTITMLASIIPNRIIAKDTSPEQTQRTEQTEKKVQIAGELEGKREKNVKHFLKNDGTFDLAIYPTAVHYQDNGTWKEIDNSLIEETDDANGAFLGNKSNDFKIKFTKNTNSNKTVSVKKDKYELSWNIEGAQNVQSTASNGADKKVEGLTEDEQKKIVNKVTSQLIYADIKPHIDLQYDLNGDNVKETFIIKEKVEIHPSY